MVLGKKKDAKEGGQEQAEELETGTELESGEGEAVERAEQEADEETGGAVRQAHDKYLRALADLENYKKRSLKERSELLRYEGQRIFEDMLEIMDNLELALAHSDADPEKVKQGIQMIHQMFQAKLEKWGVRAEPAIGKKFDPNMHSAISRVPDPETDPGTVINELKKPYFYKDRLLRAGEVVVAVQPESEEESS